MPRRASKTNPDQTNSDTTKLDSASEPVSDHDAELDLELVDEIDEPDAEPDVERGPDRRLSDEGAPDGLERRRGPGRRLSDFQRAAEEGDLTPEQFLFVMSIERFKNANSVIYPSWTDVLEVIRLLGYRKTMPSEIRLRGAEDWRESPIAPAGVRPPRWAERFSKKAA